MVYSLVFHFFQSRALAEDIAQEVYLELFKNLDRIVSDLHLSFWLRQAVTRKCIDHTRRLKHRRYQPLEDITEPGVDPEESDPFLAAALRQKVAALPDKMRMVVILRFQEDLKLSEISQALDMPVNTVKTTLRRALARLREKFATWSLRCVMEPLEDSLREVCARKAPPADFTARVMLRVRSAEPSKNIPGCAGRWPGPSRRRCSWGST